MAAIKIHGGDFGTIPCELHRKLNGDHEMVMIRGLFRRTCYVVSRDVADVEVVTQENVKRLVGTAAWGFAGGILLGPVGMLAGALAGGRSTRITFLCAFRDGKRIMATADHDAFCQIRAAAMSAAPDVPSGPGSSHAVVATRKSTPWRVLLLVAFIAALMISFVIFSRSV